MGHNLFILSILHSLIIIENLSVSGVVKRVMSLTNPVPTFTELAFSTEQQQEKTYAVEFMCSYVPARKTKFGKWRKNDVCVHTCATVNRKLQERHWLGGTGMETWKKQGVPCRYLPDIGQEKRKVLPSHLLDLLKQQGTQCSWSGWRGGKSGRHSERKRSKTKDRTWDSLV